MPRQPSHFAVSWLFFFLVRTSSVFCFFQARPDAHSTRRTRSVGLEEKKKSWRSSFVLLFLAVRIFFPRHATRAELGRARSRAPGVTAQPHTSSVELLSCSALLVYILSWYVHLSSQLCTLHLPPPLAGRIHTQFSSGDHSMDHRTTCTTI